MLKLIVLLKRKRGITHEQFREHWETVHGPLVRRLTPGILRYVQNHPEEPADGIDGVAELWFADREGFEECRRFGTSLAAEPIHDDEDLFLDRSAMRFMVVDEREISI